MTAADSITHSSTPRTHIWFLLLEWISLLAGVLLSMSTEGYFSGLILALLLFAISWIARWMRIHRLTRSTPLDVPLLIFLLSLLISFFAAPDLVSAFARLSLFLAAISFFYALVNSPPRSLNVILTLSIVVLAVASLFLIGQYDWSQE